MVIGFIKSLDDGLSLYFGSTVAAYIVAFLILASSAVLARAVNFVFEKVLFRLAIKNSSEEENQIVALLHAPMYYSVVLFGLFISLTYIKILSGYSVMLALVLKSIAVYLWTAALARIVKIVLVELSRRVSKKTKVRAQQEEMFPLFKNLSSLAVWFVGVAFLLRLWNLDLTPLLASAGIAGLAIAFAAQDTISHLFGGLSLYFDKPFRAGDRVQLDSGEIGDVLEIGVRSTKIKTFDETVVVIPNNIVASSRIINYNKPKSKIKVKIQLGLGYGTNVKKAKKAIMEVLTTTEGVEKDPEPSVSFTEMGDFALKFLVVVWVANPKKQFDVKCLLNERLYERLNKDKFVIPYPTSEVYIRK